MTATTAQHMASTAVRTTVLASSGGASITNRVGAMPAFSEMLYAMSAARKPGTKATVSIRPTSTTIIANRVAVSGVPNSAEKMPPCRTR